MTAKARIVSESIAQVNGLAVHGSTSAQDLTIKAVRPGEQMDSLGNAIVRHIEELRETA